MAKNAPEIAVIFSDWLKGDDADNDANNNAITSISNRELKLRFMPINQPQGSLNEVLHLNRNLGAVILFRIGAKSRLQRNKQNWQRWAD